MLRRGSSIGMIAVSVGVAATVTADHSAAASKKLIPGGVSMISVNATATYPRKVSVARTISRRRALSEVIALIDNMRRGQRYRACLVELAGEPKLVLRFQETQKAQPRAVATARLGGCAQVSLSTPAQKALLLGPANSANGVIELIERLLGVKL